MAPSSGSLWRGVLGWALTLFDWLCLDRLFVVGRLWLIECGYLYDCTVSNWFSAVGIATANGRLHLPLACLRKLFLFLDFMTVS